MLTLVKEDFIMFKKKKKLPIGIDIGKSIADAWEKIGNVYENEDQRNQANPCQGNEIWNVRNLVLERA